MLQTYKISTHHNHTNGRLFSHLAFLLGFTSSVFWGIFPAIIDSQSSNKSAFITFFIVVNIVALIGALSSTILFKHISRVKIFKFALLLNFIIFLLMTAHTSFYELLILEAARSFVNVFLWISLALFVRDFSRINELGRAEGKFFLFVNIGFILGFFISSLVIQNLDFRYVFFVSSILGFIAYLYFSHKHIKYKGAHIPDGVENWTFKEIINNTIEFFKVKKRIKVFLTGFSFQLWLVIYSIFMPVFILSLGFKENMIGYVLAFGIVPIIFLEEWVGIYSDRKGVKKIFAFGFFFLFFTIAMLIFNFSAYILVILIIISGIGVGIIEPLQEKLFFLSVSKKNEDRYYGIRMMSQPVAGILAPLMVLFIYNYFGIISPWIISAIVILFAGIIALGIKN